MTGGAAIEIESGTEPHTRRPSRLSQNGLHFLEIVRAGREENLFEPEQSGDRLPCASRTAAHPGIAGHKLGREGNSNHQQKEKYTREGHGWTPEYDSPDAGSGESEGYHP